MLTNNHSSETAKILNVELKQNERRVLRRVQHPTHSRVIDRCKVKLLDELGRFNQLTSRQQQQRSLCARRLKDACYSPFTIHTKLMLNIPAHMFFFFWWMR